jgi:hypothetical protein
MNPKTLLLPLMLLFAMSALAQTPSPTKQTEEDAKLEKAAIDLLRETSTEVGRLRTMENRVSFNAELASLMWFHDDKEARAMYGGVVTDFKQLLSQLDAEMNSPASADEDAGGFGMFGGYGKSRAERKLRMAMEVRKQIAMSLAEHAPELAFNFFYDSLTLISNPEFRKTQETADKGFEIQLIQQIAESNAAKGLEFGKEAIKKGVDSSHIELLKKIYAKDPDKGIEFGAAILSRLKSNSSDVEVEVYQQLLSYAGKTTEEVAKTPGKKPLYDGSEMRDIAELFAQRLMNGTLPEYMTYSAEQYAEQIDKYAPGRGAQIRAKFKVGNSNTGVSSGPAILSTANVMSNSDYSGYSSGSASNANIAMTREMEEKQARQKAETKLFEDLNGMSTKALPKEERDKFVAQARKIISQTPGKDKKLMALSLLAAQVARAGDKELANEIMGDAERFVNPQPKNYQDFLMSWMLASGYAETNPDKAFPLLESTILRANDTISAFIKVAEFIDVQDEMVSDGEVQVGMFGGSMVRGVTSELGLASSTIKTLAKADFQKTVNLTNSFDRTEIRVLAKMMVLRSVLDTDSQAELEKQRQEQIVTDDMGG